MSHLQYDPETDKSVKELTKVLINTDKLLRNLDQHLLNLIGSGDPGNGSLAGWIRYQWERVDYLPDPADIIDDRETIECWLTKIKHKLSTVTELPHSSPPVPREGTVAQELDKPPLTPTSILLPPLANTATTEDSDNMVSVSAKPSHPDELLLDNPILSLPDYLHPAVPVRETGRVPLSPVPIPNHGQIPQTESGLGSAHCTGTQAGNRLPAPESRKCPQCHETCLNAQFLA